MKSEAEHPVDGPAAEPAGINGEVPTPGNRRKTILLSCLAFFVSYVITAGPAVFIVKRFDMPMIGAIVERLYAPLILIVKLKVPILSPLIKAYVELFR